MTDCGGEDIRKPCDPQDSYITGSAMRALSARSVRLSIAFLMTTIAGLFSGLVLSRIVPSWFQSPRANVRSGLQPRKDTPFLYLGGESIVKGRLSEAREYFRREIEINPTRHEGYSQMAIVASLEGDHESALGLFEVAIKKLGRVEGNAAPLLYVRVALESLALARTDKDKASKHCVMALNALAKARASEAQPNSYASSQIEKATAAVYDEMREIAKRRGVESAVTAHRASAQKHMDAARAVDQSGARGLSRMSRE
jgi:tetratricopeptide (TPR) repeat protein